MLRLTYLAVAVNTDSGQKPLGVFDGDKPEEAAERCVLACNSTTPSLADGCLASFCIENGVSKDNLPVLVGAIGKEYAAFRQQQEAAGQQRAGEQKVVNWLVQNGFACAAQLYATGR